MEDLMKTSLMCVILACACLWQTAYGQVRTEEKRTSTDSTTGNTTVTKSVIISESEDITPRNGMITINPLKFLLFYNLTYYHRLSSLTALGLGIQVPTLSGIDGFGANAEFRLYPSQKSLRGFYVAPNMSFTSLTAGDVKTSPFSLGALIGWQWFPGDDFAMGLGIGVVGYAW
jgi:hypothetical protein